MENRGGAKGGRKAKKTEDRNGQTVKTTVTLSELNRLQLDYQRDTAARKISFAAYIRERLVQGSAVETEGQHRFDAIEIQLTLSEIVTELRRVKQHSPAEKQVEAEGQLKPTTGDQPGETGQIELIETRLAKTIEDISVWLYGSSPAKI